MSDNRRKNVGDDEALEHTPLSIFHNSYDHIGHGNHDMFQAMEHIKVLKTKKMKK